jgi:UDPglucose 6-dehydrogenase
MFLCLSQLHRDNHHALLTVARNIGRVLADVPARSPWREHPLIVVNKSTVPVGSGDYVSMFVREGIAEEASKVGPYYHHHDGEEHDDAPQAFVVPSNLEFLREGSAVYDSLFADRIVVAPTPERRSRS